LCDTFALGPSFTADGSFIFAKNSDREPGEAHLVVSIPQQEHASGDMLECTYIEIPQAKKTYSTLLCKPFWIWGAEMGVNEKGVAIGNEALFTKIKPEKVPGLIGMDLLRLGLERGATAQEAANIIVDLLKKYGQSGPCGYRDKKFTYMNSFLVVDRKEIIVLETFGRDHVMRSFSDYAAISNMTTLGNSWDRGSLKGSTDVKRLEDRIMTFFSGAPKRRSFVLERIAMLKGRFTHDDAFEILRFHQGSSPSRGGNSDICMHAADPLIRRSQTTGSMVVCLDDSDGFKIFVTAGSAPCMSTFKPVVPMAEGGFPVAIDKGGQGFSSDSWWWMHEMFHLGMLFHYSVLGRQIQDEVRSLESNVLNIPFYTWSSDDKDINDMSRSSFELTRDMERRCLDRMSCLHKDSHPLYNRYWRRIAQREGIPLAL